jgi:SulP family sulfate permease
VVGLLTLTILIVWPKINKKIPPAIVAIVASVLWVQLLGWDITTIGSKFGNLPTFLPFPSIPHITLDKMIILLPAALSIAVLGAVESLLSAVVSDGMIGGRHRSNTELIAQGIANIASALFGGIPATGAIARTMANINNGGRTPIAGIVHALTLLLMMLVLMPLAQLIPLSALAAILIVVAYHMSEWRSFLTFSRGPKSDVLILLITFLLTVFVDLIKAIEIGMILSAFLFMKRMSDVSQMRIVESDDDEDHYVIDENQKIILPPNVQMYEINGPFFFGAADQFIENLVQIKNHTETLIIRLRHVPVIDATALHAFKTMLKICDKKNIKVIITGLNPQPEEIFKKSGLYQQLGENNFYQLFEEALENL